MKHDFLRSILILFISVQGLQGLAQSKEQVNDIAFVCGPCGCADDGKFFDKPGLCPSCGMVLYASYKDMVDRPGQQHHMSTGKKVAILIFPGADIIDFAAPWEIFLQAGMQVFTVAEKDTVINMVGMRILPDYILSTAPPADIILLPGGEVDYQNTNLLNWVKRVAQESETVLSVCSGAFFLGSAGLLDGKEATTFMPLIASLQQLVPKSTIVSNKRYVDNGRIITSAGLSSGIDATFYVLSKHLGIGRTQEIAAHMEYPWDPEAKYVRAMLADKHLRGARSVFSPFETRTLLYDGNNTQWQLKLSVKTTLPLQKLLHLVEYQLENGQTWKKISSTKKKSNWKFSADNIMWQGTVECQKSPGTTDLIVTIKVNKAKN
jgi:putative intracellular protease/amidase